MLRPLVPDSLTAGGFRFGCGWRVSIPVSAPVVVRTSAGWRKGHRSRDQQHFPFRC